ncbi:MAG: YeeE/YedE family protein, partial [Methanomicrobiales archaeon]|nr:YeeE/YedE family protein [Methanomicrobiales archaeon]
MAFESLRSNGRAQLVLGLLTGIVFGFLLQKGQVTEYEVILGQLLLTDFTVVKVMLTAVLVGMIGVYAMKSLGAARLHCRMGSVGATVAGGLVFGAGFATLGYCPGTAAAAVGAGAMDALVGMVGMVAGAGLFARIYPRLDRTILNR